MNNLRDRLKRGKTEQRLDSQKDEQDRALEGKKTLSHLLTRHEGGGDAQIRALTLKYEAEPDNLDIARMLAPQLYSAQDYEGAARVYYKLIESDRKNGTYWMQYANCLARTYNLPESVQCYQRAIQLLENGEARMKCLKRLAVVEDYMRNNPR